VGSQVDLVREVYEHLNQRDWAAILAIFDDHIVLVVHESVGPEAGVFRGPDAVGHWFGEWFLAFGKDYRFELEELRDVSDRVFVLARHHGQGRSSGAGVELVNAQLFSIHRDKIVRLELYGSAAEALKTVGLEE
jgi:ketosteroid isomerase-like protein